MRKERKKQTQVLKKMTSFPHHPQYYYLLLLLPILVFTLICCLPAPVVAGMPHCTPDFWEELKTLNVAQHCHTKGLIRAEFGWTFNNDTRRLEIVFATRLDGETGWLAWGLNLDNVGMVGTRALIGLKQNNDSLSCGQFHITDLTKRGCPLVQSKDVGLNVHNCSFVYLSRMQYYAIRATMTLPDAYNSSKTIVVAQMGELISEVGPLVHPFSLKHLDNVEKMNLITNEPVYYLEHQREKLRKVHGGLNILSLGTILPLGAIVARYSSRWPSWGIALHVLLQSTGYAIGSIGWAIGLWLGSASKHYQFHTHRVLGIIIFTCATMQILAFRLKPKNDDENNKYWRMYHHSLGYTLLVLISVNIFQGIKIIQPNYMWKWTYFGVLGFLGLLAFTLEVTNWLIHWNECKQEREREKEKDKPKSAEQQPKNGKEDNKGNVPQGVGPSEEQSQPSHP